MRRVMPLKKSRSLVDASTKPASRARPPVEMNEPLRRSSSTLRRQALAEQDS